MLSPTLLRILADRNNFLAFISGIIGFILFLLAAIAPIFAWVTAGFFAVFTIYFGVQLFKKKKEGLPIGDMTNSFMDNPDMEAVMRELKERSEHAKKS